VDDENYRERIRFYGHRAAMAASYGWTSEPQIAGRWVALGGNVREVNSPR
jgi:hypothetical protein